MTRQEFPSLPIQTHRRYGEPPRLQPKSPEAAAGSIRVCHWCPQYMVPSPYVNLNTTSLWFQICAFVPYIQHGFRGVLDINETWILLDHTLI